MNRTKLNALVDGLALVSFIFLVSTGLLLKFKVPSHSGGSTLLGCTRHQWGDIHTWVSFALIFFMLIHLVLHWRWIVTVVKGKSTSLKQLRLSAGGVVLGILCLLAIIPFFAPIAQNEGKGHRYGQQQTQHEEVSATMIQFKGSTTLTQIEEETGVTISELLSSLNIPTDQPMNSKVGPLCRQYGVEMSQLRKVLEELQEH